MTIEKYAAGIHLARGNHESRSLNEVHGFEKEVLAKLNETVMDMFSDTFCCLPLAHVLNRKIIVLHGGLFSRDGVTLSDIKSIHRFCQPPKRGIYFVTVAYCDSILIEDILLLSFQDL